jgi:hypothetical protein
MSTKNWKQMGIWSHVGPFDGKQWPHIGTCTVYDNRRRTSELKLEKIVYSYYFGGLTKPRGSFKTLAACVLAVEKIMRKRKG